MGKYIPRRLRQLGPVNVACRSVVACHSLPPVSGAALNTSAWVSRARGGGVCLSREQPFYTCEMLALQVSEKLPQILKKML